jgi:alanine racemase
MQTTSSTVASAAAGVLAEAVVDLGAIAHNVRMLREHAGSAQVMAVVKADGYGHGATRVARTALAAGAAELGVATVDEALELRRRRHRAGAGVAAPAGQRLRARGGRRRADRRLLGAPARRIARRGAPHRQGGDGDGQSRHRAEPQRRRRGQYRRILRRAQAEDAVRVRGIMSHLVYPDLPDDPTNGLQAQKLADMLAHGRERGVRFEVAHLSNSSATLGRPDLAFDVVRPGIAVYGLSPFPERGDMGLVPAMTVKTTVALVRSIRAGEGVSYGHIWVADRDTNVALLPIGYADGVVRGLSGRLEVLINGRRRRGVGRICMDQFVVDLGPGRADVAEGDEAILFGPGNRGEPTAQDWADLLGTIHYEVVTGPRGRITRTYRGAEIVER